MGGVLQQQVRSSWQPLGFFSHKLSKTERNYSTFDRELLVAYMGIKHFRSRLEGRQCRSYGTVRYEPNINTKSYTEIRIDKARAESNLFIEPKHIFGLDNCTNR